MVSPTQASFIPRRTITDNVIVYQEVLHSFRICRGPTVDMLIKLDLEKAYDRIKWSFVEETLLYLGLPGNLILAIIRCVTTSSFRVLWNGEKTDVFYPSRGLRQGDPLSPYLFVLCLERLGHIINTLVEERK